MNCFSGEYSKIGCLKNKFNFVKGKLFFFLFFFILIGLVIALPRLNIVNYDDQDLGNSTSKIKESNFL